MRESAGAFAKFLQRSPLVVPSGVLVRIWLLRLTALIGLILFTLPLALTYATPAWLEGYAKDFIAAQIQSQLGSAIDAFAPTAGESKLAKAAQFVYQRKEEKVLQIKQQLKAQLPERMAAVVAEMADLDCECRQQFTRFFAEGFSFESGLLQQANDRLLGAMKGKYMQVATDLRTDVRLFSGASAAIFALLLALSGLKPRAVAHLLLPGALLMTSTLIAAYLYVFEQNWLLTIIYGDYQAGTYLIWLALIFGLLMDIVMNAGRVVTTVLNAGFEAVGSTVTLAPC